MLLVGGARFSSFLVESCLNPPPSCPLPWKCVCRRIQCLNRRVIHYVRSKASDDVAQEILREDSTPPPSSLALAFLGPSSRSSLPLPSPTPAIFSSPVPPAHINPIEEASLTAEATPTIGSSQSPIQNANKPSPVQNDSSPAMPPDACTGSAFKSGCLHPCRYYSRY